MTTQRSVISTEHAPGAIGPYSQAIVAGDLVFCSGQLPMDPSTGQLVTGSIEEQTRRVLDNLSGLLEAAGSSRKHVVKTTIFLADMNDFAAVNATYAEYFDQEPPARSTVEVARLPRDARVEIEAIALRA
ncbi:MAG TPA: RidA family protein [Herpetosiphonaceae bacterium]